MFKTITEELSKDEVIDLLRGMDAQEINDKFSVFRILDKTQAYKIFGGDSEDSCSLAPGTYLAVYYDLLETENPFFEKTCESIITDEDKCQSLMNEGGCILIFMLKKYD